MLTDQEKMLLSDAMAALSENDAPWKSIAALTQLAQSGTDVSVDFTTRSTLGVPVIIAQRRAPVHSPLLTRRQNTVCALLADGKSNKAIARALGITPATVKDHVHAILKRLGLQSRAEVAAHLHRTTD